MSTYKINREGDVLRIGFGAPAQNDEIVKDVEGRLEEMMLDGELTGGGTLKINGPASLPVAIVITHNVVHLFDAIACFDPKMNAYIVCISHGSEHSVGDII